MNFYDMLWKHSEKVVLLGKRSKQHGYYCTWYHTTTLCLKLSNGSVSLFQVLGF